jgi:3-(3-hydroxy-phenyl)propionate hydroxylase
VSDYDVIICGFGPVGQVAANMLGQRGYRVAVFETATSVYNQPRAAHFDGEVMRILQSIGLAEAVMPASAPVKGMHFLDAAGEKLFGFDAPEGPGAQGWAAGYMFYQPDFEKALQAGVERFPRVEVYQGHDVLGIAEIDGSVMVRVRDLGKGNERTVRADYLWGCDGARSLTRKALGIELEDLEFDQPWLVVDTMLRRDVDLPGVAQQHCDPARPVTFVPSAGRHRRWEFMLMPGEEPAEMERSETVWRLLAPWVTPADTEVVRAVVYSFHALIAKQYRRGRAFLLGDAAHQMPPFLGQGMCAGIRDVQNVAWKLDLVRAGLAGDSIFDTYYEERAPHVRTIIKRAVTAGQIIQATDRRIAEARDRMFSEAARKEFVIGEDMGGIELKMPRLSSGMLGGSPTAGSPVGELFPQPCVTVNRAAEVLLDEVLADGFVVVMEPGASGHLAAEVRAAWDWLGPQFVQVHPGIGCEWSQTDCAMVGEADERLVEWLRCHGTAVVRPDRYVYGTARCDEDLVRLAGALRQQLGA